MLVPQQLATVLIGAVAVLAAPSVYRQGAVSRVQPIEVPLQRTSFGLFGNITVGTPPQPLVAFFDWTWFSLYTISAECGGDVGATAKCLSPQQSFYNQSASSTFKDEATMFADRGWNPNEFFPNTSFDVSYGEDVTAIQSASAPVIFQAGNEPPGVFVKKPFNFASIYGLAPVFKSDNGAF